MTPLLPLEALTVAVRTGEVMGHVSAAVPAFPPTYRLGSAQYDGWPLPIGASAVVYPVLSQDVRNRAAGAPYVLDCVGADPQQWFAASGDPLGTIAVSSAAVPAINGGEYLYFSSKVKRRVVSDAYWGSYQYIVTRTFTNAQSRNVWVPNLFDEPTQTAWNDAGGYSSEIIPLLAQEPIGCEDIGTTAAFSAFPAFTDQYSLLGTAVLGTLDADPRKWLRLGQLEIPTDGNSVIVSAQIETLFPGTEPIAVLQRQCAKRFADPLDWERQQRDFNTAVSRQGDIPALNCVPLPSFRLQTDGVVQDYRQGFQTHGDFTMMAWTPCADDESSVWVLNRIRLPRPVMLPNIKPSTVGLSERFTNDEQWASMTAPAPGIVANPDKLIGESAWPILPETGQIGAWFPFLTSLVGGSYPSIFATSENVGELTRFKLTTFRSTGGFAQNQYGTGNEVPQDVFDAATASNQFVAIPAQMLGDFPCIGFSVEEAMRNAPAVITLQGFFSEEIDGEIQRFSWKYQCAKVAGAYQHVKAECFGNPDALEELEQQTITSWANAFYNDPSKFDVRGVYEWRRAQDLTVWLSQPIYGHIDLVNDFTVSVDFS